MTAPNRKRKYLIALLLFWLLPALACNFPSVQKRQQAAVERAVQQTLQAMSLPTSLPPVETASPLPEGAQPSPTFELPGISPPQQPAGSVYAYVTQSGDTLPALEKRFGVAAWQISPVGVLPSQGLISPGIQLTIPNTLGETPYSGALLPDSEIVYSPSAAAFDIDQFVSAAGGYLSGYSEEVDGLSLSGAAIVRQVAYETSTNPRVLLAALEFQSGWVYGQPRNPLPDYPLGFQVGNYAGLYKQLILTQRQLTIGYYGWRAGTLTQLDFEGSSPVRIDPRLNAGTVAVQYLFKVLYKQASWAPRLYGQDNFVSLHTRMFGDPWARAAQVEPLLPADLQQPQLELPFRPGEPWNLTGGPHAAWGSGNPRGGVDFAPSRPERGCTVSQAWATAAAPGVVTRSEDGLVVLDLDGDGYEQTGWSLLYLHLAEKDRVAPGTRLNTDDPLGHPSCEGGAATGTHVHMARKYNGEWLAAGGPLPFVMSGWLVNPGEKNYQGSLTKGDQVVTAQPDGSHGSLIVRQ